MQGQRFWFLAPGDEDTLPEVAVSVPWWPEIQPRWAHNPEQGREYLEAPIIFTTREAAEGWLAYYNDPDVALRQYQQLRERYEEEIVERAYNNTTPLRVFEMSKDDILWRLEDSYFLCVMVDDRLRLRRDLIEELKGGTGEED